MDVGPSQSELQVSGGQGRRLQARARGVAWSRKAGPRRLNLASAMDARGVTAMTMRYDRINKTVLNAAASGLLLRRW
ncbi:hypothetical protein ASE29_31885 [Ensifer sp. Root74]|nr:hypothetical protein ASD49_31855 [Ensifer sp. Root1298]KQX83724.1 hypothetical protein ASD41_32470 [Ensifer sp. Root1312]KRC20251.1 hypothetical protein ASE29_31885 [Ensifer sp. Root74]